jgi:peptidoglycan/xylan/chitin deacetylase (PgdA/CDA1 family)
MQAAQDTLQGITGQRPQFFRAPAGIRSPLLDPVLTRLELKLASWTARGFDTQSGNVDKVNRRLQKGLKAGAILLLHDGNAAQSSTGVPVVLEVLPLVLEAVGAAGLHCVTLRHALRDAR